MAFGTEIVARGVIGVRGGTTPQGRVKSSKTGFLPYRLCTNGGIFFRMTRDFDLFGDPVPANFGARGRPGHRATAENRNRLKLLLGFGWSNERIANALAISVPTLREYYFSELAERDRARDRQDAALAAALWAQVEAGNVGAMREFQKLQEHNDAMRFGQFKHPAEEAPKEAPLGKKAAADQAAHEPDRSSTLGDLMARRMN